MSRLKLYIFNIFEALIGPLVLQGVIIWTARNSSPDALFLYFYVIAGFALLQALIDSGFSSSIIRDEVINKVKLDTVFFITFLISISILIPFIFFLSNGIDDFAENILSILFLCFGFLFYNIGLVPKALLVKERKFKQMAGVATFGSLFGVVLYILLIFYVNALLALCIMFLWRNLFSSIAYFILTKYKPSWRYYNITSIKVYIKFSQDLTISNAVNNLYEFLNLVFIKKVFGETNAGLYTQMDSLKNFISINFVSLLNRAFFVDLTTLKDNSLEMKKVYKLVLINAIYIIGFVSSFIFIFSDVLILRIYGASYEKGSDILKVFMLISLIFPLHAFQTLLFQVYGDSKRFLNLEMLKKALMIPLYFAGFFMNIWDFSIGLLVLSIIMLFLYDQKSFSIVLFPMKRQVLLVLPVFFIYVISLFLLYFLKEFVLVELNLFYYLLLHFLFYFLITRLIFSNIYSRTVLLYFSKFNEFLWNSRF